jgi:hypothetical protein
LNIAKVFPKNIVFFLPIESQKYPAKKYPIKEPIKKIEPNIFIYSSEIPQSFYKIAGKNIEKTVSIPSTKSISPMTMYTYEIVVKNNYISK